MTKTVNAKAADDKFIDVTPVTYLSRLMTSATSIDINLKEVRCYELSVVPYYLAHSYGSLRKTSKNSILSAMEKKMSIQANLSAPLIGISTDGMIDAMDSVQIIKSGVVSTFAYLVSTMRLLHHQDKMDAPVSMRYLASITCYQSKLVKDRDGGINGYGN